jgi:mono/diheme cytochrome c family protein
LFANAQGENVNIKKVPLTYTDPTNGKEMFNTYCAVCHGLDCKGNGPAATALKTPLSDLSLLSRTHEGKFPMTLVRGTLHGGPTMPAGHGSTDMPIWGPLLSSGQQDQGMAELRIRNISKYIESLQVK